MVQEISLAIIRSKRMQVQGRLKVQCKNTIVCEIELYSLRLDSATGSPSLETDKTKKRFESRNLE
jgi:hypothetical protein